MKNLLTLALLTICSFSNLSAQRLSPEVTRIANTDLEKLIVELRALPTAEMNQWISDREIRSQVIRKLDTLIECRYIIWDDRKVAADYIKKYPSYFSTIDSFHLKKADDFRSIHEMLFFDDWPILYRFLQFNDVTIEEKSMKDNLSQMNFHSSLEYLLENYKNDAFGILDSTWINQHEDPFYSDALKTRNVNLLDALTAKLESEKFIYYQSNEVSRKSIKEFDFYMDNDLFVLSGNQDREYTGGGGINISTDFFDSKWIDPLWVFTKRAKSKGLPQRKVLSYQSVGLNMSFYTPYIRYRNNFDLADEFYKFDRPFSSYVYLDRSKYRLWPGGRLRNKSSLQVGQIGSSLGRDIQGTLHRDAAVESQKVYGWENQIANGGRWLVQYNNTIEALLISNTNKRDFLVHNKLKSISDHSKVRPKSGINLIAGLTLNAGGYLTAVEPSLTFSTVDFINRSGGERLAAFKKNVYQFAWSFQASFRYRRVIHNSMLEGFGYLNTYRDDRFDDEALSTYTINYEAHEKYDAANINSNRSVYPRVGRADDRVNRNLFLADFKLNFTWRKMSLYYSTTLLSKEYYLPGKNADSENKYSFSEDDFERFNDFLNNENGAVEPSNQTFFDNNIKEEQRLFGGRKAYGYGRVGVLWKL